MVKITVKVAAQIASVNRPLYFGLAATKIDIPTGNLQPTSLQIFENRSKGTKCARECLLPAKGVP